MSIVFVVVSHYHNIHVELSSLLFPQSPSLEIQQNSIFLFISYLETRLNKNPLLRHTKAGCYKFLILAIYRVAIAIYINFVQGVKIAKNYNALFLYFSFLSVFKSVIIA